jgi:hypothetical protein
MYRSLIGWPRDIEALLGANTDGLHAIRKISSPSKARARGALGSLVLPISVVDRLLHDLPLALSNLVKRARYGPANSYAACASGSRYAPPRAIRTQAIRAILVGHGDGGDLGRAPLQKFDQPRATRAVSLCVSDHRKAADDKEPPQVVIATLRYFAETLFSTTG